MNSGSLSGEPFEVVAEGQSDGLPIHSFPQPLSIQVGYDPALLHGEEASLTLFYFDEALGDWLPLPTQVDSTTQTLTAASDHLTVFDFNSQNWEAARLPGLDIPPCVPTLLHGDAQKNNYISTAAGAVVIDPAVYYGSPEMDLAYLDVFEPVPEEVFLGYREELPIDPGFTFCPGELPIWAVVSVCP